MSALDSEHTLASDKFARPMVANGLFGLAVKVQALLIREKGSMPNDPDMGVDVGSWRFEDNSPRSLDELRREAESQIEDYIPDIPLGAVDVVVEKESADGGRTVKVNVSLTEEVDGRDGMVLSFDQHPTRELVPTFTI